MEKIILPFCQKFYVGKRFLKNCGKEIQKDIRFYDKNTELFAVWTFLYGVMVVLFILAIQGNVLIKFLLFIVSIVITAATMVLTIFYLHALKYDTNQLTTNAHQIANKSFKVRRLFRFAKNIPLYISLTISFLKHLKHLRIRLAFQ